MLRPVKTLPEQILDITRQLPEGEASRVDSCNSAPELHYSEGCPAWWQKESCFAWNEVSMSQPSKAASVCGAQLQKGSSDRWGVLEVKSGVVQRKHEAPQAGPHPRRKASAHRGNADVPIRQKAEGTRWRHLLNSNIE